MNDPELQSSLPTRLGWRQLLVSLVMLLALGSVFGESLWQGMLPVNAAESEAAAQASDDPAVVGPKRPTEKQIKAYSGLAALAGIVICGLALAALTILWAGRLRRQIRRPLPNGARSERDFWFLKPPKPTVTESSLPDAHQPLHESPDPPDERE
ncbi:MAG TPA: hypothetical protein VGM98_25435 [Schlesneria sp.]|jgi:hypothetical protein